MSKEATPTVLAIGQIGFEGHIIPHTWYDHITYKTPKGTEKVDLQAIVILSDIVYWYRPRVILDERTGEVLRYERRFSADKLQRNYQQIADRFGMSKNQAARACKRLRDLGLITMEFRTVQTGKGPLPNVLFLEPVPQKLVQINHARVSLQNCQDIPTKSSGHPDEIVKTNTKNTSENTPKKKPAPQAAKPEIIEVEDSPLPGEATPWKGPPPPAARVFRSRANRHPPRVTYRRIHETVGDRAEDLERWGEVVGQYIALGWNPTNVAGMLEWFEKGELPRVQRKNGGVNKGQRNKEIVASWMQGWQQAEQIEAEWEVI